MFNKSGHLCGIRQVRGREPNDEIQKFREERQRIKRELDALLGISGMNLMPRVPKENYLPPAYVQENIDILNAAEARKKPKNHPKPLDRKERAKRKQDFESRMFEEKNQLSQ